jgi:putative oxidoreductase
MHPGEKIVRWSVYVSRMALALVFVFAGGIKAADPNAFAEEIMRYQLVPWPVAVSLAFWLPFLEMAAGAGILIPALRSGALTTVTGLLITFTAALLSAWRRGLNIDCGCFGPALGPQTVIRALERDVVLLALLAWVWVHQLRRVRGNLAATPENGSATNAERIRTKS